MTESQENPDITATTTRRSRRGQPGPLYRALAWVGIVAGSLFIVATVFFSGYVLGKNSDAGPHHGPNRMLLTPFHKGMGPDGPMMGPRDRIGPGSGGMGPGEGPRSERLTPPSVSSVAPSP
jgi:hypothetical protein